MQVVEELGVLVGSDSGMDFAPTTQMAGEPELPSRTRMPGPRLVWLGHAVAMVLALGAATSPVYGQTLLPVTSTMQPVNGVDGPLVTLAGQVEPLMEPNGQPLFSATNCQTSLAFQAATGGFDLVITVRNPTSQPQQRPRFMLTGLRMSDRLTYLNPRGIGRLESWDATGLPSKWSPRYNYPDHLYSPVHAMFDQRFAVGISLVYDILEERHGMSTHFGREGGSYTGTYKVTLEPYLRDQSGEPAELIAPGVTETSRIAVRFATPVDWIDTLEPYRQYFRGRFGSVRYQADRRPVWGEAISTVQHIGKNPGGTSYPNPRGFNAYRADRNGWGPFVDMVLRDVIPRGYERIMLWNPSGMYSTGQNFPVEFMTEWSPEMADSVAELDRLKAAGVTIGMWWGHAGHVSGGFNSGQLWVRDTSNPADLAAGDAELDLAAQRRTDEVGLDSVVALPLWDRYPWMLRNLQRYPSLRYVTEHHDTDIMHTIAPTYLSPWSWWNQPAVLADWLNPGHETWVQLWWNEVTAEVVEQILDYGMVPVTMTTAIDLTARPCTYSLQPSASAFGLEGGAGSIAIATSGATCDWVVRSGASWITITGSTAGRGSGTIRFSVAPTSGSTGRTGTVTVATRTVGISQLAPPTIAVTSPTTASEFSAEGSTVSLAGSVSGDTGVSVSWASDLGQTGVASVRVGPDTMTWTAPAIPLHSGANTLTLTATDAAGNRASRVVTVNARSMVYYLAEGATAGTFDTDVHLANPNPVPAPVKVTCLREDGTTVVTAYTIPAFGQLTVHLDDIPLLGSTAVGTVVESSAGVPLIVERSMFW